MYRGTTPTLTIKLHTTLLLDQIEAIWLTFETTRDEDITFTEDDMIIDADNSQLIVKLSQEDTLALKPGTCKVQLRIRMSNENAYVTREKQIIVHDILKEGVI